MNPYCGTKNRMHWLCITLHRMKSVHSLNYSLVQIHWSKFAWVNCEWIIPFECDFFGQIEMDFSHRVKKNSKVSLIATGDHLNSFRHCLLYILFVVIRWNLLTYSPFLSQAIPFLAHPIFGLILRNILCNTAFFLLDDSKKTRGKMLFPSKKKNWEAKNLIWPQDE